MEVCTTPPSSLYVSLSHTRTDAVWRQSALASSRDNWGDWRQRDGPQLGPRHARLPRMRMGRDLPAAAELNICSSIFQRFWDESMCQGHKMCSSVFRRSKHASPNITPSAAPQESGEICLTALCLVKRRYTTQATLGALSPLPPRDRGSLDRRRCKHLGRAPCLRNAGAIARELPRGTRRFRSCPMAGSPGRMGRNAPPNTRGLCCPARCSPLAG